MHTQVKPQPRTWLRIPAISMIVPCATAVLLTWGSSSIGGNSDNRAAAPVLSAMLTPAYSTNEGRADTARVSVVANAPMCTAPGEPSNASAEFGAAGCVEEATEALTEVATFLEWHVQARHLAQNAYQITLSALPRLQANSDPWTALSAAAPLWVTFAR